MITSSVDGAGATPCVSYPDHTEWLARMLCPTIYKSYIDFITTFSGEIYPVKPVYDTLEQVVGEVIVAIESSCDRRQHYQIKQEACGI